MALIYSKQAKCFVSDCDTYSKIVVAAVVILCGDESFFEKFMVLADKMGMTDPDEYVYLHILRGAVDKLLLPSSKSRSRTVRARAFRPVLKVS